jgi:hypothetical protein
MVNLDLQNLSHNDIPAALRYLIEKVNSLSARLDQGIQSTPAQPTEYLTRREVLALAKISSPTLKDWNRTGRLAPLTIGTRHRYRRSDVEAALKTTKSVNHGNR